MWGRRPQKRHSSLTLLSPKHVTINRDHFRDFEAYRPVPDTLARPRIGWPWARNAEPLSFFPPRRKATTAKARVNVRMLGSAPWRRGYYRQCAIERSQFPRGLRHVGHVRCCFSTPLRVSLITVSTHMIRRCVRRSAMFIAPKSRYSR